MFSSTCRRSLLSLLLALPLVLAAPGCDETFTNEGDPATDATPNLSSFDGHGVGIGCGDDGDCRSGLECQGGYCDAVGTSPANEKCLLTAECSGDLHCGWAGFCVPSGTGTLGSQCATATDCVRGLYCNIQGIGGFCTDQTADDTLGDIDLPCESTADCLAGLSCSNNSWTCQPGSILLTPDLFSGVPCWQAAEEAMDFGVRTVVPGSVETSDFYSMPYPTDTRRVGGKVDISDHPRPGPGLIGFDPLGQVIDAIGEDVDGFSVMPAVFFRFTHPIDEETIDTKGQDASVLLVDLGTGERVDATASFAADRNKYACHNRLMVRPVMKRPLAEGHTYAAIVTTDLRSAPAETGDSRKPVPLDDLPMLLGDSAPGGGDDKHAWDAYAPLRDWIDDGGINASDIAGATVFTTGHPTSPMSGIREAVHLALEPQVMEGPVLCEAGVKSPCATPGWADTPGGQEGLDDPRDCPATPSALYWEHHVRLQIPTVQEGERPYLDEGGSLKRDGGAIKPTGYETICVAIGVPKNATQPDSGWPLMIYGHGTGGNYRNGLLLLAASAAQLTAPDGTQVPMAIVAYDQPMHFDRKVVDVDPGPLFYNYRNPRAALGNYFQGAADVFALVRFFKDYQSIFDGLGEVKFDGAKLLYHGHSQGGGNGPLFMAFEPDIQLVVLSGTGGGTVEGILGKKAPYDSSVGLQLMLHEINLEMNHPALFLLQHYFDPIDPGSYGPLLDAPPSGKAVHLLHVYGANDSFTPPLSIGIYAAAANTDLIIPGGSLPNWFDDLSQLDVNTETAPLSLNRTVGGTQVSRITIQGLNDTATSLSGTAYDGHFVIYRNPEANQRFMEFVATWLATGVPEVR